MSEIYWIIVLSKFGIVLRLVAALFAAFFLILSIISYVDCEEFKETKRFVKYFIISLVFLMSSIFIPSKEEFIAIFGLGKTIEYLKDNEHTQNIPDNLLEYLDKLTKELVDDK